MEKSNNPGKRIVAAGLLLACATALLTSACSDHADAPTAEGADRWYAQSGWPAIHRDARNSDTATVSVPATSFEPTFRALEGSIVGAVLTTDASGSVFATTFATPGTLCRVFSLDPHSGEQQWCSDLLSGLAVSSSVTIDLDGNLYVAGRAAGRRGRQPRGNGLYRRATAGH